MTKDRRLGRGLAALLGAPLDDVGEQPGMEFDAVPIAKTLPADGGNGRTAAQSGALLHLNVYEIEDNPFQPRRDFGESEIASLAESLREHDMLQPILVRRLGDRYQLISGERRLRAAIQAGWTTVPARVREADDRLVAELAIVENLQRKDLNPIEKAMSFKRYLEEHRCSQEDLARRLKIDRSTIANLMRLLELPETVLAALRVGQLSAGHARALLPLGDEKLQNEFCQRIVDEGWSVRAVEAEVQQRIEQEDAPLLSIVGASSGSGSTTSKPATKRRGSDQVAFLEQELRIALGTKVEIRQASRGRGRIVVHFSNHDEFERLRQLLNGQHAGGSQADVG
ncbi:MAG: ParB/RepB/Spo0J family partition protein [Pirellulaceae bacterium]|nr:ParB/RepB/Spo0J family partition protein [Pirellulaceae bacterium]